MPGELELEGVLDGVGELDAELVVDGVGVTQVPSAVIEISEPSPASPPLNHLILQATQVLHLIPLLHLILLLTLTLQA